MNNLTQFSSFKLAGYVDIGRLSYLYFFIVLVLYISICFFNTLLILVICTERSLHKPMYMFMCSLFVNDLYGSTGLFPALMTNLLSDDHSISTVYCYIQLFCMYSFVLIEFSNLAVMSYDRYLAICYPLHYNILMTRKRVCILVCVIWLLTFVNVIIILLLTVRLQLCGNVIDKVFCDNYLIVKLACSKSDAAVNNIFGLYVICLLVGVPLFAICLSYIKILSICLKSTIEVRKKALSTCTPHLAALLNLAFGSLLNVLESRFDKPMENVPTELKILLSVYHILCLPLFNPIVYGVRMSKIRQACKNILPVSLNTKT